jgi:mannosyltransferase OCH1-like enzyme
MIPKLIHQIWIQGIKELPKKLYDNHLLIKKSNPLYEIKLWDNESISKLLKDKLPKLYYVYINCDKLGGFGSKFTCMSDIGRFAILYEYGGVYIDLDYECSIDISKLYNENDKITVANNNYILYKLVEKFIYTPKYNMSFCIFAPKQIIWDDIFNIILHAKTKHEIGTVVDKYLQNNNIKPKIIRENDVSSHQACNVNKKCFSPKESSWYNGREIIVTIGCNIKKIIFVIIIILFLYLLYKIIEK